MLIVYDLDGRCQCKESAQAVRHPNGTVICSCCFKKRIVEETSKVPEMTMAEAKEFVEKHLLFNHIKLMRLVTTESISAWVFSKARNIRDEVNAVLQYNSTLPFDEDVEKALKFWKGKHGNKF